MLSTLAILEGLLLHLGVKYVSSTRIPLLYINNHVYTRLTSTGSTNYFEADTYRLKRGIQNSVAGISTAPETAKLTYLLPASVPLVRDRP